GGPAVLDSLVFGGAREPALEPGQVSGWVDFPGGMARVRLDRRTTPDPGELKLAMENERRMAVESHLSEYFEQLRKRYAVRILDNDLRAVALPTPPPPPQN